MVSDYSGAAVRSLPIRTAFRVFRFSFAGGTRYNLRALHSRRLACNRKGTPFDPKEKGEKET
jgi:hypothetical protein